MLSMVGVQYPIFSVDVPLFADEETRQAFQNIQAVTGWYKDAHGTCPSPWAMSGESRCDAVGPFDYDRKLVFTQQRFQRGQVVWVKDGVYAGHPDVSFGPYQCWEGSKQENKSQHSGNGFWRSTQVLHQNQWKRPLCLCPL